MKRRDFLKLSAAAAAATPHLAREQMPIDAAAAPPSDGAKADITLRIAPVTVELTPEHVVSTIGYNGAPPPAPSCA